MIFDVKSYNEKINLISKTYFDDIKILTENTEELLNCIIHSMSAIIVAIVMSYGIDGKKEECLNILLGGLAESTAKDFNRIKDLNKQKENK
jgi:hypothetical protein